MIPLRDTIQSRNYPVANTLIIAVNVAVYLLQAAQGLDGNRFILTYGLVPARYSVPEIAAYFTWWQQIIAFASFMFLHGGFWHLLGNMWSLYIFGDNVEDRLGSLRYIFFYLLCGIASGLTHLMINLSSKVPTVGASGAIAGVMGAYLLLYPRSKILTLIPIFFIPYFIELPAFLFIGIWFLLQFVSAAASSAGGGGIAWWAHIGGFVFGIIFLKLLLRLPRTGLSDRVRSRTTKHRTPRLQVVRPRAGDGDPNLYGTIAVTPREARSGAQKLINVPWGFQKRLFRVTIPPGIRDGTVLRLEGMGTQAGDVRGDLNLKVTLQEEQ